MVEKFDAMSIRFAMLFGLEKLEWCGYTRWWKKFAMFIRFDRIHERDRQTHTHTHRMTA